MHTWRKVASCILCSILLFNTNWFWFSEELDLHTGLLKYHAVKWYDVILPTVQGYHILLTFLRERAQFAEFLSVFRVNTSSHHEVTLNPIKTIYLRIILVFPVLHIFFLCFIYLPPYLVKLEVFADSVSKLWLFNVNCHYLMPLRSSTASG